MPSPRSTIYLKFMYFKFFEPIVDPRSSILVFQWTSKFRSCTLPKSFAVIQKSRTWFLCLITESYPCFFRRVSQPPIALGCEETIRFLNTIRTFAISVLPQMISVKCMTAMHTGRRCPFKVQSGNSSISSENLFKPSQRKSWYGTILANICRLVGVEVVENSKVYSDHVCMQSLRPKNPESRITVWAH